MKALDRYKRADSPPPPEPTEAHVRAIGFIDEMVTTMLAQNTALSPIVRMMQRMRPALLRDLATIPEDQLTAFLVDLGSRMIRAGGSVPMVFPVGNPLDVDNLKDVEPPDDQVPGDIVPVPEYCRIESHSETGCTCADNVVTNGSGPHSG